MRRFFFFFFFKQLKIFEGGGGLTPQKHPSAYAKINVVGLASGACKMATGWNAPMGLENGANIMLRVSLNPMTGVIIMFAPRNKVLGAL